MIPTRVECTTSKPDDKGNIQFTYRFVGARNGPLVRTVEIGRELIASKGLEYAAHKALMLAIQALPTSSGTCLLENAGAGE